MWSQKGVIERFFGFEIFDFGIFLVTISFTWGFFAYSKQFEVVICMLLMKQKMFLGLLSVVWVLLETIGNFFFFCRLSRNINILESIFFTKQELITLGGS